ncbi:hypothetical protein [Blattabacterium punctulatus]|uniref:hypothetical protein n=1 Tax=Blattabacterium punctulatus TaxID=164514 RepID=UPI001F2B7142|nr:hypothetical protein [Blattabacterium punctulatus]
MSIFFRKKLFSDLIGSPLSTKTLSIPKKFRSIKAFSVIYLLKQPKIRCGTPSIPYLFIILEKISILPGHMDTAFICKKPFYFSI